LLLITVAAVGFVVLMPVEAALPNPVCLPDVDRSATSQVGASTEVSWFGWRRPSIRKPSDQDDGKPNLAAKASILSGNSA